VFCLCAIAADDGMRLSGAETSSSGRRSELRFSDKTSVSVSPARSHNAAASAAASSSFVSVMENASTPHSVTTCACVTPYTSPMSRTRPAHCVLNSSLYTIASASSADVYMSDSVLRDSERRRGRFMCSVLFICELPLVQCSALA